jgi:hypothetical protein
MEYQFKSPPEKLKELNTKLTRQQINEHGTAIEKLEAKVDDLVEVVTNLPTKMAEVLSEHVAGCPYRRAADGLVEDTTRDVLIRAKRKRAREANLELAVRRTTYSWIPKAVSKVPKPVWYIFTGIAVGIASKYGIDLTALFQ